MIHPDELKEYLSRRLTAFRSGAPFYRYTCPGRGGPGSLAASCGALLISRAAGLLTENDSARKEWAGYINSFQNSETGWYLDDASRWVRDYRLKPWLFGFALRGLNALGYRPKYPLSFLQGWDNKGDLTEWVNRGKGIMHMGILLLHSGIRLPWMDRGVFTESFFRILESAPVWFTPDKSAYYAAAERRNFVHHHRVLKDPFHISFPYYAAEKLPMEPELIIDWHLLLQQDDGLFFRPDKPSYYFQMDAVQLLTEYREYLAYRSEEIREAVSRVLRAILGRPGFPEIWDRADLHQLLALIETVTQGLRSQPDHPFQKWNWKRIWDLSMWKTEETLIPELSGWRKNG